MKTRNLLPYLLPALVLIACHQQKSQTVLPGQPSEVKDSTHSIAFLKAMGISTDSLLTTLPSSPFKQRIRLTNAQWTVLLNGVVSRTNKDDCAISNAHLSSILKLSQDKYLCIYIVKRKIGNETYLVTYNHDGQKIDALFGGTEYLSDTLTYTGSAEEYTYQEQFSSTIHFTDATHFSSTTRYTEHPSDISAAKSGPTYTFETEGKYQINEKGQFTQLKRTRKETGKAITKGEQDVVNRIIELRQLPQSDDHTMSQWNQLGTTTDGAAAELFGYAFIEYLYKPQPQRVLKWIYKRSGRKDNRFILDKFLESAILMEDITLEQIESDIEKIDDEQMKKGLKQMAKQWDISSQPNP